MNVLWYTMEPSKSHVRPEPLVFTWYGKDARAFMAPRIPEVCVEVRELGCGWFRYRARLNPSDLERNGFYNPDLLQRRLVRMPDYLVDFSRVQVQS